MGISEEWNIAKYMKTFTSRAKLQPEIFKQLQDCNWHCRDCASKGIDSKQYAGGGGIKGLKKGTNDRPGLVIETDVAQCFDCQETKRCDRWTGQYQTSNPASGISESLKDRILKYYNYTDSVEQRKRSPHELIIDHRFPMGRWGAAEEKNLPSMSDDEINKKFQLLKKDSSGNHNLLKSRACEQCIKDKKRGFPLGIKFYYAGDENWPNDCPTVGSLAEQGCIGCGWYDLNKWKSELNAFITVKSNKE